MGLTVERTVAALVVVGIILSAVSSSILKRNAESNEEQRHVENIECNEGIIPISLVQGDQVILETAGYNRPFIPNCQENWEISLTREKTDLRQSRIRIEVIDMNLPCASAKLSIEEDSKKTAAYCGNQKIEPFTSHEHFVTMHMNTKETCEENGGCFGFGTKLKISAEYVCGGKFTEDNGFITSPFYPYNYPPSTSCIYDISGPLGGHVAWTCHTFNLSGECDTKKCRPNMGEKDFLQDILQFKRYEETGLAGQTIVSKSFHQTLYFLSNSFHLSESDAANFGFNCTYKFI